MLREHRMLLRLSLLHAWFKLYWDTELLWLENPFTATESLGAACWCTAVAHWSYGVTPHIESGFPRAGGRGTSQGALSAIFFFLLLPTELDLQPIILNPEPSTLILTPTPQLPGGGRASQGAAGARRLRISRVRSAARMLSTPHSAYLRSLLSRLGKRESLITLTLHSSSSFITPTPHSSSSFISLNMWW